MVSKSGQPEMLEKKLVQLEIFPDISSRGVCCPRLDVEKKKMLDLCRKMRKLGLQHMCDIKGSASIKADSEARLAKIEIWDR